MNWFSISLLAILFGKTDKLVDRNNDHYPTQKGFAVVELFTSEGCSSCPPADEAIAEIQNKHMDGVHVLSFHVDYWNYLGWKDEFSDAAYSARQNRYASAFHLESIYTPQVVVNGKKEFVGSDKIQLEKTIDESLKATGNSDIQFNASVTTGQHITVQYETNANDRYQLNVVLVQLKAESDVKRGENKGRKLKHINVVRSIKEISLKNNGKGSIQFEIPAGLNKNDCKVVAYLQDKNSLVIAGVKEDTIQ